MPEISRRLFLFGSAAVLAAAAIPVGVRPVPALAPYLNRKIFDLSIGFDQHEGNHVAQIELIQNGKASLKWGMNTQGMLRWVACPGDEISLGPEDTYTVSVQSPVGVGRVYMMCKDTVDEHDPILRQEEHIFFQTTPPLCRIYDLDPDNSVAARIERKRLREEANARYEEECRLGLHPEIDSFLDDDYVD